MDIEVMQARRGFFLRGEEEKNKEGNPKDSFRKPPKREGHACLLPRLPLVCPFTDD